MRVMSDEKVQAIVIGAGLAGCAAAYRLAKAGKEVMLVEKGSAAGSKNVSGGRIYTYSLDKLMPGEWSEAPLERKINRELMMLMTPEDSLAIDSTFGSMDSESYSVLRSKFDSWLSDKAEEAGAMLIPGTTVEGLIVRDGKVCGIKTDEEELESDIVIDAEGVNALAAESAGLTDKLSPSDAAVGLKYVFQLTEEKINDRFNVESGQGVALLAAGACTRGVNGGGAFLYTNTDSISVGLVADTLSLKRSGLKIVDLSNEFIQHPSIGRYLEGAKLIEYSAHLIPEGGFHAATKNKLYAPGFLIAGDAAGLVVNRGFTVRGMDYAIVSGIHAADTALEALEANDFSEQKLSAYEERLNAVVMKDLKTMNKSHDYITHTKYMFTAYPALAAGVMKSLYTVKDEPLKGAMKTVMQTVKGQKVSLFGAAKDAFKGGRSL
ncbi:MAG: FAD-dependent oxidoreductase [Sporolactobacillus sp.]